MFRLLVKSFFKNTPKFEEVATFQFSDDALLLADHYAKGGNSVFVCGRGMFYSEEILWSNTEGYDPGTTLDKNEGVAS